MLDVPAILTHDLRLPDLPAGAGAETAVKPTPVLRTDRLVLKQPHLGDAPAVARAYATDADVTRYLGWEPHGSMDDTHVFFRDLLRRQRSGAAWAWLVTDADGGAVLGMVELTRRQGEWRAGGVLAKERWRRGFMSEALAPILDWARDEQGVRRVHAMVDVENAAGCGFLESVGFGRGERLEAHAVRPALGDAPRDSWRFDRDT